MRTHIAVLNHTGHLSLEWDDANPEEVANARAEVRRLKDAGYSFFIVEDGATVPADEVRLGKGKLIVQRVDDPTEEPEPAPTDPPKRGRPPGTQRVIATQPLRGG